MALDKQNKHKIILKTQKKVGINLVKLSVVLRKPLEVIPNMIAIIYLSKIVTKEMKSRSWI